MKEFSQHQIDVASGLSYTASGGTIIAGFTLNEIGIIVGIFIAVGTFLINWMYKHLNYKLNVRERKRRKK